MNSFVIHYQKHFIQEMLLMKIQIRNMFKSHVLIPFEVARVDIIYFVV